MEPALKSVFKRRPPLGKPVKGSQFMMNFWETIHAKSPTAMDIPKLSDGSCNLEKLNKRRQSLSQMILGFAERWPKWKEY